VNPRICASILPENIDSSLSLVEIAEEQGVDFIEIRLDLIKDYHRLSDITCCSNLPKIATIRTLDSHGFFPGSERERKLALLEAAKANFEFIDFEISNHNSNKIISEFEDFALRKIISYHDYNKTPSIFHLKEILSKQKGKGADICKIVTTAKTAYDNIVLLNFTREASTTTSLICFSMGKLGQTSRILAPLFGGFLTMASVEKKAETASGQLTVQEMKRIYKVLGV
jgi:3-dehydroquinate dehydratase type I